MTFYLLAFVVALAIFGLYRSPNARERLHMRSIYNRSSEVILKSLGVYRQHLLEFLGLNEEHVDIFEIADEGEDGLVIEEIERSDSIEEIQGIRIRNNQTPLEITEQTIIVQDGSEATGTQESNEHDNVLTAITASLHRLSTAANSGNLSGAQLYGILLQETLLHDQAVRKQSLEAATAAPSAPPKEALRHGQQSPGEAANAPKVRMYFGQSPLEYKPHQK